MIKGIYVAGRSLDQKMKNISTVANNIANLNTTGYKREVPFLEILSQVSQPVVKDITDFNQGDAIPTENPLDLFINGKGFFTIKTERGLEFTRNGKFNVSNDGFLVNDQGYRVMGRNGEINLTTTKFDENQTLSISKTGEIKIGEQPVDTLLIAHLDNLQQPKRIDGASFITVDDEFQLAGESDFEIKQGYLEESNVNAIIEMESMIQINKEYETASKMIAALDQSLEKAVDIGRV
ncbi:MAG: flagellar hook-basal body protein [Ignavibacteriales bacterium]|nr:MAG: flagellar hook-basal body protein [Ignavibacteriales bacterium]